ncbi:MAG: hypothetical protein R3350_00485 [Saprospiraceae bacterium]|nr:hypothetical protein [Saprospiraceae bacterium]
MSKKEFEALRELVYFVDKNRVKEIDIVGENGNGGDHSRLDEFYEGILSSRFENDKQAAEGLEFSGPRNNMYKKLRTSLQKRLLNTVFFIDLKGNAYTDRQKTYYEIQKNWAATRVLIGKNARTIGIRLCHKILKEAKKYEFSEIVLDIARYLRLHYGTREGDVNKFEKYNKLYRKYARIWQDENEVEEKYAELITRYVNNKATQEESNRRAAEYYEELKHRLKRSKTYRTQFCGFLIRLIRHSSIHDYEKTKVVCEEAIALFESKPYTASVPLQVFYYQQLICYTQLKQYEEGRKAAEQCLLQLEKGSFNWFKYQELFLIFLMHTGRYQEAYKVFSETVGHRKLSYMPQSVRETWRIIEAYVHYLVDVGKVQPEEGDDRFTKFRLGKFLNETPLFSKDRRGMNIPILIIQILFMIQQERYDRAIDRIEAIEKYCSRYLRKDDTFRSNCFIKMLLQIPASSFHKAAVLRKAEKYRKKLDSVPLDIANQTVEIEIIPYGKLWEMALETLDYEFH